MSRYPSPALLPHQVGARERRTGLPLGPRACERVGAPRKPGDSGRREHEPSIIMTRCSRCGMPLCWRLRCGRVVLSSSARWPRLQSSTSSVHAVRRAGCWQAPSSARLLERFTVIAYGCAAVVLLSLAVRGVLGPRPRRFAYRVAGLLLMSAATVYAGAVLAPRIAAIQRSIGDGAVGARFGPILDASSSGGCTACRFRCS